MMAGIKNYLSMIVFAHTIFAMPFALIGFFLATQYDQYSFNWTNLLFVILCMVFARSAAMGFNRWADRSIDKKNPRTANREIPQGTISARSAFLFTLVNAILFIVSAGFLNTLVLYLSPIALLVVMGYSYTKRFTRWSHLFLGIGLALAPIGAYLAVAEAFSWLPLLFSLVVISWVSGFDIIYSLQDADFDAANQLNSVPSKYGKAGALKISIMLHSLTTLTVVGIGIFWDFGWLFWIGAVCFIFLLIYQHSIVSPGNLSRVNRAFGTTNGIASLVLAVFVILDLFLNH